MKHHYISLKNLLLAEVKEPLNKLTQKPDSSLPTTLGHWHLEADIDTFKKATSTGLGVYRHGAQKMIVKKWAGNFSDSNFYYHTNEITAYETLSKVLTRLNKGKFSTMVTIPRILFKSLTKSSIIFGIQYIKGKSAVNLTPKQKVNVYKATLNFLSQLGTIITKHEETFLTKRSIWEMIFLYPFTLFLALLLHPNQATSLLSGLKIVFFSLPDLIKKQKLVLSHRDLCFDNIIVKHSKIFLIDLATVAFATKYDDFVTTLKYSWSDVALRKLLLKELKKIVSKKDLTYFRALAIMVGTHGIATNSLSNSKINSYANFLKFFIKTNL